MGPIPDHWYRARPRSTEYPLHPTSTEANLKCRHNEEVEPRGAPWDDDLRYIQKQATYIQTLSRTNGQQSCQYDKYVPRQTGKPAIASNNGHGRIIADRPTESDLGGIPICAGLPPWLLILLVGWSGSVHAEEQAKEDEEEGQGDGDANLNTRVLVKDDAKRRQECDQTIPHRSAPNVTPRNGRLTPTSTTHKEDYI